MARQQVPRHAFRGHAERVPLPDGLHLGELLQEGIVVLEGGFATDGVRDVVRGKSAAQLSQFARPPDPN